MAEVSPLLQARYRGDDAEVARLLGGGPELDVFEAATFGRLDRLRALIAADAVNGLVHLDGHSAMGGAVVAVVGVRGRRIGAYSPDGRMLGEADCGVGPTHVRAGAGGLFYVADTQGGAVLVFRAGPDGIRQVGRESTGGGAPYGLAVDAARSRLYVTLTGTNQLRSYRIDGEKLTAERTWATVRQPNDVAVDDVTGRVAVAGTGDGLLQFIEPTG